MSTTLSKSNELVPIPKLRNLPVSSAAALLHPGLLALISCSAKWLYFTAAAAAEAIAAVADAADVLF